MEKRANSLPCVGTFAFCKGFDRRPPFIPSTDATVALLLAIFAADEMFAVDLANNLDVAMPLLVRVGRCVVVILVNVYGGNSFKINESIIRAIC